MKKKLKIILIIISSLLVIILVDTMQALLFDNNPLIGIETRGMKKVGIFVDTYHCGNGRHDTVIKGFSYTCSYSSDFVIVDTSKEIKNFSCAAVLEEIYEDGLYTYYLSCMKSKYIEVRYKGNKKESLIFALKNNHININDLDKFLIDYIKVEKESYEK